MTPIAIISLLSIIINQAVVHGGLARRRNFAQEEIPAELTNQEFALVDIVFINSQATPMIDVLRKLEHSEVHPVVFYDNAEHSLSDLCNENYKGTFKLVASTGEKMSVHDIGKALHAKNISHMRPTLMTIADESLSLNQIVERYGAEKKAHIKISYDGGREQIHYNANKINVTQFYSLIFENVDKTQVFDFSEIKVGRLSINETLALRFLLYVPGIEILYEGTKYPIADFVFGVHGPNFVGAYKVYKNNHSLTTKQISEVVSMYTIINNLNVNFIKMSVNQIIDSLKRVPDLYIYYAANFTRYTPNEIKSTGIPPQMIQIFSDGNLLQISSVITTLAVKGELIFDTTLITDLKSLDVTIEYEGQMYSVDAFISLFGASKVPYKIIFNGKHLHYMEAKALLQSEHRIDLYYEENITSPVENISTSEAHKDQINGGSSSVANSKSNRTISNNSLKLQYSQKYTPIQMLQLLANENAPIQVKYRNKFYTPAKFLEQFPDLSEDIKFINVNDVNGGNFPEYLEVDKISNNAKNSNNSSQDYDNHSNQKRGESNSDSASFKDILYDADNMREIEGSNPIKADDPSKLVRNNPDPKKFEHKGHLYEPEVEKFTEIPEDIKLVKEEKIDLDDTQDLLTQLAQHNPDHLKVEQDDQYYEPEVILEKFSEIPKDNKLMEEESVSEDSKDRDLLVHLAANNPDHKKVEHKGHLHEHKIDHFTEIPKDIKLVKEEKIDIDDTQDLLTQLAQNNPEHLKVEEVDHYYEPEVILTKFPKFPKEESISENSDDQDSHLAANNPDDKKVEHKGHLYEPEMQQFTEIPEVIKLVKEEKIDLDDTQDLLKQLAQNNPEYLKVEKVDHYYEPEVILEKLPEILKDIKLIKEESISADSEGQNLLTQLAENNPDHNKVEHEGHLYEPEEFLEKFPQIPEDTKLVKEASIKPDQIPSVLSQLVQNNPDHLKVKQDEPYYTPEDILEQFPTIPTNIKLVKEELINADSEGQNLLTQLAENNPHHNKIEHEGHLYEPEEFLEKFPQIPEDTKLVKEASIKPDQIRGVLSTLAQNNPDHLKVKQDEQYYKPEDILEQFPTIPTNIKLVKEELINADSEGQNLLTQLAENNPHHNKVEHEGHLYEPEEFLEKFPQIPEDTKLVQEASIKPDEIQSVLSQLVQNNPDHLKVKQDEPYFTPKDILEQVTTIPTNIKLVKEEIINADSEGQNILTQLAEKNPHHNKVEHEGHLYEPEEFLEKFPQIPEDTKLVQEETIKPDQIRFVLSTLAQNNPDHLKVKQDEQYYKPEDILEQFPTIPTNIKLVKKELINADSEGQNLLTQLAENNPHHNKVEHEGHLYEPEEFLEKFPQIPEDTKLVQEASIKPDEIQSVLSQLVQNNPDHLKVKQDEPYFTPKDILEQVTTIPTNIKLVKEEIINADSEGQNILTQLAEKNPHHNKVEHEGHLYEPEEFLEKFPQIPEDTKLVQEETIKPDQIRFVLSTLAQNNPDHLKVKQDDQYYKPEDILEQLPTIPTNIKLVKEEIINTDSEGQNLLTQLAENNPNHNKVEHEGHLYEPEEFLEKFPQIPEDTKLVKEAIIKPDHIRGVLSQLAHSNPDHLKVKQDEQYYKPEDILDEFLEIPDKFKLVKEQSINSDSTPEDLLSQLAQSNPEHMKVKHESQYNEPEEFLELLPQTPEDTKIVKEESINLDDQTRDLLEELAKDNPEHVKVKHDDKIYEPEALLEEFPELPKDLKVIEEEDINQDVEAREVISELAEDNPDHTKVKYEIFTETPKDISVVEDNNSYKANDQTESLQSKYEYLQDAVADIENTFIKNEMEDLDKISQIQSEIDKVSHDIQTNPNINVDEFDSHFEPEFAIKYHESEENNESVPSKFNSRMNIPIKNPEVRRITINMLDKIKSVCHSNSDVVIILYRGEVYYPEDFWRKYPNIPSDIQIIFGNKLITPAEMTRADPFLFKKAKRNKEEKVQSLETDMVRAMCQVEDGLNTSDNLAPVTVNESHQGNRKSIIAIKKKLSGTRKSVGLEVQMSKDEHPSDSAVRFRNKLYNVNQIDTKLNANQPHSNKAQRRTLLLDPKTELEMRYKPMLSMIEQGGEVYTPRHMVRLLKKDNPKGLKVRYGSHLYTPAEFLQKHPGVDTNFQLVHNGAVVPQHSVHEYVQFPIAKEPSRKIFIHDNHQVGTRTVRAGEMAIGSQQSSRLVTHTLPIINVAHGRRSSLNLQEQSKESC